MKTIKRFFAALVIGTQLQLLPVFPGLQEAQSLLKTQISHAEQNVRPALFLFAHGMWGSNKNADWYAKNDSTMWHLITGPFLSFDFDDVGKGKGAVLRKKVNLGQKDDVAKLMSVYNAMSEKLSPSEVIVLIGSSRGAITSLNAAGTEKMPDLGAVIAEAPADDVLHVLDYNLGKYYLNWNILVSLFSKALPYYYTKHDPNGLNPLKTVAAIPADLPILLVHAQDDDFVSINSSRALYLQLRLTGHDNVYLLELPHGKHGKYNLSPSATMYEAAVHAFYKKYNIPYVPSIAEEGEKYLAQAQPDLEDIKGRLKGVYARKFEKPEVFLIPQRGTRTDFPFIQEDVVH